MLATYTNHASQRTQQRGFPPLISNWLLDYGDKVFDGHGGVIRYYSSNGTVAAWLQPFFDQQSLGQGVKPELTAVE